MVVNAWALFEIHGNTVRKLMILLPKDEIYKRHDGHLGNGSMVSPNHRNTKKKMGIKRIDVSYPLYCYIKT